MKTRNIIAHFTITLLMSGALSAHAQPASEPSAAETSHTMSAKEIRKANRLLCQKVRHALLEIRGLDSQDISTICRSGVVTLAGTVPEAPQADVAASATRGVDGVESVKNALIARPPGN